MLGALLGAQEGRRAAARSYTGSKTGGGVVATNQPLKGVPHKTPPTRADSPYIYIYDIYIYIYDIYIYIYMYVCVCVCGRG